MADEGRRIPYIIELGVKDESLRKQMAKWDWEKITGIKDLGKHFEKPAEEASAAIENAIAHTNIDWEKALQTDAFKSAVTKIVQHANKELREGLLGKDEAKQATEFISEIGKAWKEVGVAMDARDFARSMAAFAKSVQPLVGQVDKLTAAFDELFNKTEQKNKKQVVPVVELTDGTKKIQKFEKDIVDLNVLLDKVSKKSIGIRVKKDVKNQFSELNAEVMRVESSIAELENELKSVGKNSNRGREISVQLAKERLEVVNYYRQMEKIDEKYRAEHGNQSLFINKVDVQKEIKEATEYANAIIKQLAKVEEVVGHSENAINVEIALPSVDAIKKKLNETIKKLNKPDVLEKIVVELDTATDLSNKDLVGTKKSNQDAKVNEEEFKKNIKRLQALHKEKKELEDLQNPKKGGVFAPTRDHRIKEIEKETDLLIAVQQGINKTKGTYGEHTIASIIKALDSIDAVVGQKTSGWREKIVKAFQLDKGEIKVPFTAESSAEVIFNEVQNFFNDHEIDLHLNKEAFVNEIKQAVAEGGVSVGGLGGGTVAFDEKTMAMAIATGLQAFFTGDFKPVTGEKKTVKGVQEPKKTHTYFDPSNPFNRDVARSLGEVLKASTEKGGGKIKEFFSARGIDVEKMANASAGELLEMLGQLTDRFGATIADQFKQLMSDLGKNSASSKVGNFLGDFRELLYTNRISQTTVDDDLKKKKQLELWDNYSKKSVLDSGLGSLLGLTSKRVDISKLDSKRIPSRDDIQEYIDVASSFADQNGLNSINQQIAETRRRIEEIEETEDAKKLQVLTKEKDDLYAQYREAQKSGRFTEFKSINEQIQEKREAIAEINKKENIKELLSLERRLPSLQTKQNEMQMAFDKFNPVVKMLETIKEDRMDLIDVGDDSQKRVFVDALKKFQSAMGAFRNDLSEELNGYAWNLEVDGMKGTEDVSSTGKASRLYRGALGRNNSKVKVAHLYAAPDAQRDWLDPRPDRTAIRNIDTTIPEFKLKENTSKRWEEENTAAVEASKRATESAELVAKTEKRLADGAQAESAIKTQIEELAKQRAADGATIASNEEELSNIADKKEARKAKKRAETLDARLEAARKEKAIAEKQAEEYKDTDYSARDAEERAIDAEIRKLKKWQKDPEKYRDNQDLIDMIYAEEMDKAEEDWKQKKAIEKQLKANFESTDKDFERQIASQEGFAKRARERGDVDMARNIEKNIDELKNARAELPKTIVEAVKAREEAEKKFVAILDKIEGETDEDKAAFTADAQAKLGERIRTRQSAKQRLAPNMRVEAETRLKKADTEIAKLEVEKAELEATQAYKDAKRIEELETQNKNAKNRIKQDKADIKSKKDELKNLAPEKTTQELLDSYDDKIRELSENNAKLEADNKKVDISKEAIEQNNKAIEANNKEIDRLRAEMDVDGVSKEIAKLDDKLQATTEEVAKVEAYVDSVVKDEKYKKPDGTIKHTKKNEKTIAKYNDASKKANYLNKLINNEEIASDERFANFNPEEQTAVDDINKDRTYLRYIDKMRSVLKDEFGQDQSPELIPELIHKDLNEIVEEIVSADESRQYQSPELIYKDLNEIVGEIVSANKENQARAKAEGATEHEKARAAWSQKLVDEVSTFMENYRASGVINGAGAENFFEEYWEPMVGSLRENISKQSDSLKSIANDSAEVAKTLQPEIEAANQHLKETYVKRIQGWFKKIRDKQKIIAKGEADGADEAAKNAAGLAVKEISDLFPLIATAISKYKEEFGEELTLAENDAELLKDRNKYSYRGFIDKKTSSVKDDIASKKSAILSSERVTLLKTRRGELLKDIKNAKPDSAELKALETSLSEVNNELSKYQKYTTILSSDAITSVFYEDEQFATEYSAKLEEIIKKENELDLARAKGASQSDINKQYSSINAARIESEDMLRQKLQEKQSALLENIKVNNTEGKSVTALVEQLDLVNAELVELEVNHNRRQQTSIGGDLYKASTTSVKSYTDALKEAIIAKQKLNKLEAEGADTKEAAKASKKAENNVKEAINRAVNARVNGPVNTDPRAQALDYLDATEDPYQIALAKVKDAERRERKYASEVENIRTNDRYSTSNEYKKHYNSIKSELTTDYVRSDDYKADRDDALKSVKEEFIKEVAKRFGTDDDGNLSEKGQKVLYEFWNNQKGKRADKLDPSKFKETLGRLMQNGTDDPNEDNELNKARKEAEDEFKNSKEYKELVATREKVLSDALEASKEALRQAYDASSSGTEVKDADLQNKFNLIDQEVAENIQFLRETTVGNYPLLEEEINKILDGKTPTPKEYEEAVEKARNNLIKQEETKAIERKNAEAYSKYKTEETKISKPILKETNALLRDKTEAYIRQYFENWINSAFSDDEFAGDSDAEEIINVFKSLMEEKVYGLAGKHGQKLEVRDGFLSGANLSEEDRKRYVTDDAGNIDVQRTAEQRAERARKIAEEDKKKALAEVADIEKKRKEAMEKGGLSRADAMDAETKKELAEFQAKVTAEKARQAELTAEITRLEKEGASVDELGAVKEQLHQTEANIDKFEKFIHNRELLIEMNRKAAEDEKKIQTYTLDEQKLFYESKRAKAKERLGSDDAKVREKAEADVARFDDILERIATKMEAEAAKEREKNDPMNIIANKFADAIKKSLGGNGGLNVDATELATEATLTQIYEILVGIVQAMGGKVIRDPEKDAMLAELRALKAKKTTANGQSENSNKTPTTNNNTGKSGTQKKHREPEPDFIIKAREYKKELENSTDPISDVRKAIKAINDLGDESKGTEEYLLAQVKLQKALNAYFDKGKTMDFEGLGWDEYKRGEHKGEKYHNRESLMSYLLKQDGITEEGYNLKRTEAEAKEAAKTIVDVKPQVAPNAVAEEVKENTEQTPPIAEVQPEVTKEDANAYVAKLQEILGGVSGDTKGTENSLKAVSDAMGRLKKIKGVEAFNEFKESLLALQSGKGSIEDATQKAQKFVDTFANYKNNSFSDLGDWFGKDVRADATTLLGVLKQIFELTSKEQAARKATKKAEEVKPAQQVAEAAEREAAATAQVSEEKAEQKAIESSYTTEDARRERELTQKLGGYTGPQVDFSEADIGLAQEETLQKIYDILQKIKTEGIKKGGTTSNKRVSEATLIQNRALQNEAAIVGIGGNGKLIREYNNLVVALKNAVTEFNGLSKAEQKKSENLNNVKKLAQQVSAMGFNIMKEASVWDAKLAQSDKVGTIDPSSDVRTQMEDLAKADLNGKQYKFLNFDGKNLSYQLTDIDGNVEKVTMSWSELNNQVAITSDKSVSKLDTLANKVSIFGDKFKDAVDAGYLADNDADLERFKKKIEEIKNAIANEGSFADVEKLRNEALRIADEVTKKVNKVKRFYSGTTEMNAATKQHDNLEFSGVLDQEDISVVKAYNTAYAALLAKHNEFKTAGTLYDPNNQKLLQQMAIHVKALGKELDIAQSEMQDLQQKVLNSGMYNGKDIGDISQVQQGIDVYAQMRAKLEELGATNIKVDRIRQKATGTIRVNNRLVHDLEVAYHELSGSMARYHKQERESLTGIPAFLNGFKKKFNSIMQYLSMTMSIHQIIAQLRQGIQYIKEIDLALTELKKVTDETEETYDRFLETAAKTGARLGTTISAVTEATATFAKLGYTMEQSTEMAEAAIVYKNVGDNIASTGDAADSIISTMKGFGLEASESMAIVDKFNEVGNRFAITSQGIGEALRVSASALNEGKNSLDESIALITAANEVVNDPSSVGTALKTLTLRLRGEICASLYSNIQLKVA